MFQLYYSWYWKSIYRNINLNDYKMIIDTKNKTKKMKNEKLYIYKLLF